MIKPLRFDLSSTKPRNVLGFLILIVFLPIAVVFNLLLAALLLLDPRSWRFNKVEALAILDRELSRFTNLSYDECLKDVERDPVLTKTIIGESGAEYQVRIELIWDRCSNSPIRILGGIDDGRLRAYRPLIRSVVIQPSVRKEVAT